MRFMILCLLAFLMIGCFESPTEVVEKERIVLDTINTITEIDTVTKQDTIYDTVYIKEVQVVDNGISNSGHLEKDTAIYMTLHDSNFIVFDTVIEYKKFENQPDLVDKKWVTGFIKIDFPFLVDLDFFEIWVVSKEYYDTLKIKQTAFSGSGVQTALVYWDTPTFSFIPNNHSVNELDSIMRYNDYIFGAEQQYRLESIETSSYSLQVVRYDMLLNPNFMYENYEVFPLVYPKIGQEVVVVFRKKYDY